MTVDEYRAKHPDCEYCNHSIPLYDTCFAINKRKSRRRAKKCPLYVPKKWEYNTDKKDGALNVFDELEFEIAQLDYDSAETRAIAIEGIIAELKKKYTERSEEDVQNKTREGE